MVLFFDIFSFRFASVIDDCHVKENGDKEVKVKEGKKHRKPERRLKTKQSKHLLRCLHNSFLLVFLTEATANIYMYYISGVIQNKWGKDFVLVTGDGLKIKDSSGTQGRPTCIIFLSIA